MLLGQVGLDITTLVVYLEFQRWIKVFYADSECLVSPSHDVHIDTLISHHVNELKFAHHPLHVEFHLAQVSFGLGQVL